MFRTHHHLLLSSPEFLTEAQVVLMTEAVTDTDRARPWAAVEVVATLLHPMTTTMIAVDLLGAIVHVVTTTVGDLLPVNFTTDAREDTEGVRRLVDVSLMSTARHARATPRIPTMLGSDRHPVVTMTHI